MKQKFFGIVAVLALAFASFGSVDAAQGDFSPQGPGSGLRQSGIVGGNYPNPVGPPVYPSGTGSSVQFNLFADDYAMAYHRGKVPYSTYNCMWIDTDNDGNPGPPTQACRDAIGNYAGAVNYADERDFFVGAVHDPSLALDDYFAYLNPHQYEHTLPTALQPGDMIRTFVWVHNNGQEGGPAVANNTTIDFDWSTPGQVHASITSPDADFGSSNNGTITDTFTYNLAGNYGLQPVELTHYNFPDAGASFNGIVSQQTLSLPNSQTTYTFNEGTHLPCYGNVRGVFVDFVVVDNYQFDLTKTANPVAGSTVVAGQTVTYTLSVENTGQLPLTNFTVTDAIPTDMTYVANSATSSHGGTFTVNAGMLDGTFGTAIAVGDTATVTFDVTVNATAGVGTQICNQFDGSVTILTTMTGTSASICHIVGATSSILFDKVALSPTAGTPVQFGDTITYQLTVQNPHFAPLSGVTIQENLPDGLLLVNGPTPFVFNPLAANNCITQYPGDPTDNPLGPGSGTGGPIGVDPYPGDPTDPTGPTGGILVPDPFPGDPTDPTGPTGGILVPDPFPGDPNTNSPTGFFSNIAYAQVAEFVPTFTLQDDNEGGKDKPLNNGDNGILKAINLAIPVPTIPGCTEAVTTLTVQVMADVNGTQICNNASASTATANSANVSVCHPFTDTGVPFFEILKTANPVDGSNVAAGSNIDYTIAMVNNTAEDFTNVLATDVLDANLTYVGITPGDATVVATTNSGITTLDFDFNTILAGATETQGFTTTVNPATPLTTVIPNVADGTANYANQVTPLTATSNITNHTVGNSTGGGPGGGGSAPTVDIVSICATDVYGGAFCQNQYPHISNGAPYSNYIACIKQDDHPFYKNECLSAWADDMELTRCEGNYNNTQDVLPDSCLEILPKQCEVVGCSDCFDDTRMFFTKNIVNEDGSLTKEVTVPKGETIDYALGLTIALGNSSNDIVNGVVRFYDYTIPHDSSGWLWNREGIISDQWNDADENGKYFEVNLRNLKGDGGDALSELNQTGKVSLDMFYTLDTALAIDADEADVENVAFATLEYDYITYDAEGNPQVSTDTIAIGKESDPLCGVPDDVPDYFSILTENSLHSVGQEAHLAKVGSLGDSTLTKIVRPFIEVKGGGNVSVDSGQGEKLFANDYVSQEFQQYVEEAFSGEIFDDRGQTIELQEAAYLDELYENAQASGVKVSEFGVNWITTADDTGVYFLDGDTSDTAINLVAPAQAFEAPRTYVTTGRDVYVPSDFELRGAFGAFIIQGGDLIIDSEVEYMEGLFIALPEGEEGGRIISGDTSDKQLIVSGSLIGNTRDLFLNRRYIGSDPASELEPSVKVNFDLRLLDSTPPGVQDVLGDQWRQESY